MVCIRTGDDEIGTNTRDVWIASWSCQRGTAEGVAEAGTYCRKDHAWVGMMEIESNESLGCQATRDRGIVPNATLWTVRENCIQCCRVLNSCNGLTVGSHQK